MNRRGFLRSFCVGIVAGTVLAKTSLSLVDDEPEKQDIVLRFTESEWTHIDAAFQHADSIVISGGVNDFKVSV